LLAKRKRLVVSKTEVKAKGSSQGELDAQIGEAVQTSLVSFGALDALSSESR
jgi:hypothetical protein